jgi:hypothetical protein
MRSHEIARDSTRSHEITGAAQQQQLSSSSAPVQSLSRRADTVLIGPWSCVSRTQLKSTFDSTRVPPQKPSLMLIAACVAARSQSCRGMCAEAGGGGRSAAERSHACIRVAHYTRRCAQSSCHSSAPGRALHFACPTHPLRGSGSPPRACFWGTWAWHHAIVRPSHCCPAPAAHRAAPRPNRPRAQTRCPRPARAARHHAARSRAHQCG